MSAADRIAVRMPGGEIRSVPRRVGLGMIARNQAKAAPHQNVPPAGAKGRLPVETAASGVQVVTAESPALAPQAAPLKHVEVEITTDPDTAKLLGVRESPTVNVVADDVAALPIVAPEVEAPKGNAGRAAWADYATVHGVSVSDEMGRNEIRDTVVAKLESDRMSRPAFTGGRPATPEDEPVTEDMVTSADPGERKT